MRAHAPSHLSGGRRREVPSREGVHGMLQEEKLEWNYFQEARVKNRQAERRDRPQSAPLERREGGREGRREGGVRFHERDLPRPEGEAGRGGKEGRGAGRKGKPNPSERCSETQRRWAKEKVVEKYGINLCP
eukprot:305868-Rhodomonas_salina.1